MKRLWLDYLGLIVPITLFVVAIYYILVRDPILPTSIRAILDRSQNMPLLIHLTVLGLLPFYIAITISALGLLSMQLGKLIKRRR